MSADVVTSPWRTGFPTPVLTGSGSKGVSQPGSSMLIVRRAPLALGRPKLIQDLEFGKARANYRASRVTGGPIVRLVCQLRDGSRSL